MLSLLPVIYVFFGSIFLLWFVSFWWAIFLQGAAVALQGLIAALFTSWDFLLYSGIPTAIICLALGVILCKNPINSLFCLIGVFLNSILLFLSIRVEFLSMIFLIVYIGAIAILFLFVIMLLNLRNLSYKKITWTARNLSYFVIFAGLSVKCYFSLINAINIASYYNRKIFSSSQITCLGFPNFSQYHYHLQYGFNDVLLFSELLYTEHLMLLLLSGMLLLAAMVGSIVLAISTVEEI